MPKPKKSKLAALLQAAEGIPPPSGGRTAQASNKAAAQPRHDASTTQPLPRRFQLDPVASDPLASIAVASDLADQPRAPAYQLLVGQLIKGGKANHALKRRRMEEQGDSEQSEDASDSEQDTDHDVVPASKQRSKLAQRKPEQKQGAGRGAANASAAARQQDGKDRGGAQHAVAGKQQNGGALGSEPDDGSQPEDDDAPR